MYKSFRVWFCYVTITFFCFISTSNNMSFVIMAILQSLSQLLLYKELFWQIFVTQSYARAWTRVSLYAQSSLSHQHFIFCGTTESRASYYCSYHYYYYMRQQCKKKFSNINDLPKNERTPESPGYDTSCVMIIQTYHYTTQRSYVYT